MWIHDGPLEASAYTKQRPEERAQGNWVIHESFSSKVIHYLMFPFPIKIVQRVVYNSTACRGGTGWRYTLHSHSMPHTLRREAIHAIFNPNGPWVLTATFIPPSSLRYRHHHHFFLRGLYPTYRTTSFPPLHIWPLLYLFHHHCRVLVKHIPFMRFFYCLL